MARRHPLSYAIAALGLIVVVRPADAHPLACAAQSVWDSFRRRILLRVAGGLATTGMLALYLRGEKRLPGVHLDALFCILLLLAGLLLSIACGGVLVVPDGPIEPECRCRCSVAGDFVGWLSWKYHEPAEKRSLRMAVSLYLSSA